MDRLVAIIDPSHITRKILEVCLRRAAGLECISFSSGEDALRALAARTRLIPAIIVLEIDLPDIDGLQVTRLLRCDRAFDKTRIVVLSGHDTFLKRLQAKRAGAQRFLSKPFNRLLFLSIVAEYIDAERVSSLDAPAHLRTGGWSYGASELLSSPGPARGLSAYSARG